MDDPHWCNFSTIGLFVRTQMNTNIFKHFSFGYKVKKSNLKLFYFDSSKWFFWITNKIFFLGLFTDLLLLTLPFFTDLFLLIGLTWGTFLLTFWFIALTHLNQLNHQKESFRFVVNYSFTWKPIAWSQDWLYKSNIPVRCFYFIDEWNWSVQESLVKVQGGRNQMWRGVVPG